MTYSEKMLKALRNEDLAEAQLSLTEALKKDDQEVLAELGEELFAIGFLAEAKEVFETLKQREPAEELYNLPLAEIAIETMRSRRPLSFWKLFPKKEMCMYSHYWSWLIFIRS